MADNAEKITYTRPDGVEVVVPIIRAGMPDLFVALRPPNADPYIMAPRDLDPQRIVDFFSERVEQVDEMRVEMLKRYSKTNSQKCRYQTGDVAYVMGRPFQLRVYPLAETQQRIKGGARGRTTSKYSIAPDVSLLTLYITHPQNYDEGKRAFNGYAEVVILNNAVRLVHDLSAHLIPDKKEPTVRLRAMRDRWSCNEAGALWLSEDIIPYPPDCLVLVIWRELEKLSTMPEEEKRKHLEHIMPGWKAARDLLANHAEPYCLQ